MSVLHWGALIGLKFRKCVSAEAAATLFVDIPLPRKNFFPKRKFTFDDVFRVKYAKDELQLLFLFNDKIFHCLQERADNLLLVPDVTVRSLIDKTNFALVSVRASKDQKIFRVEHQFNRLFCRGEPNIEVLSGKFKGRRLAVYANWVRFAVRCGGEFLSLRVLDSIKGRTQRCG